MGRLFAREAREREQRDELLSAYLDDELSARDRARLEAQLATDPALRAELEALRRTVALVRDLPSVSVPRNFILPRTMAARPRPVRPRRAWAAPLLTAATAVVSLVFVVVLAGDLLLSGLGRQAFAPAAEPVLEAEAPQVALAPSPTGEEVVAEAVVEAEAEEEVEVEKAVPAATAPAMPTEAPLEAAPEATARAERTDAGTPEGVEAPAPGMGGGGPTEQPTAPTPTAVPSVAEGPTAPAPTPGPPEAEEAAAAPTALATATTTPGQVAPRAAEEVEPQAAESGRGAPEREGAQVAAIPPWRLLEAILGLTALGLALATVWAWRARRR
jgi:hypothetical protein